MVVALDGVTVVVALDEMAVVVALDGVTVFSKCTHTCSTWV